MAPWRDENHRIPADAGVALSQGVALGAVLVLSLLASGCSEDSETDEAVPAGAVAAVGGQPVTEKEFDRALAIATKQEQRTAPLIASPVPPDPPSYAKCIAAQRREGNALADFNLKVMCKEDFVRLRDQVMSQLLQSAQLEKLAGEKDVVVTAKEVNAALANLKKQGHLSENAFKNRLAQLGMTRQDILSGLRTQLLSAKIARDFGTDQAALQAAQERLKQETTCRQGYIFRAACGNAPE